MHTYEQWTRSEIVRLRTEAQKATAEADTLQRTFDKWLESQGHKNEASAQKKTDSKHLGNGHSPPRRGRRLGHGSKNSKAIGMIKAASPDGLTIDEIFKGFTESFGAKYKRSSMRALLFNQKKLGNIENRSGRYVIAGGQNT